MDPSRSFFRERWNEISNETAVVRFDFARTSCVCYEFEMPVFLSDIYYVQADYERIWVENKATVEMMIQGGIKDEEFFCARGLEKATPAGKRRKDRIRRRAREAILNEQWRQFDECEDDPDLLAEIYKTYTVYLEKDAQDLGASDARCAKQIYMNVNAPIKRGSRCSISDDITVATDELSSQFSLTSFDSEESSDIVHKSALNKNSDDKDFSREPRLASFFGSFLKRKE